MGFCCNFHSSIQFMHVHGWEMRIELEHYWSRMFMLLQDLPNNMIHQVAIKSLPQEWLWCETWCDDASKQYSKTIDLVSCCFSLHWILCVAWGVFNKHKIMGIGFRHAFRRFSLYWHSFPRLKWPLSPFGAEVKNVWCHFFFFLVPNTCLWHGARLNIGTALLFTSDSVWS